VNWSTGEKTDSIQVDTGLFYVSISDQSGCPPSYDSIYIQGLPPLIYSLTISDSVVCSQELSTLTLSLSDGRPPYSAIWSDGQSGLSIEAMHGTYSVIIDDSSGCGPYYDTVTIGVVDSFYVDLSTPANNYTVCDSNDQVVLHANITGNNPPYLLNWSSGEITDSISVNPGKYTVEVTGALGCVCISDTFNLEVPEPMTISIAPPKPLICFGEDSALLNVDIEGGIAPYTIIWNGLENIVSIWAKEGPISVKVTDGSGCFKDSATADVERLSQPSKAEAGADQIICEAQDTIQLSGQYFNASYALWSGGLGEFYPSRKEPNAQYIPDSSERNSQKLKIQYITFTNTGCPPDSDQVELYLSQAPYLSVKGPTALCNDNDVFYYSAQKNKSIKYDWSVLGGEIFDRPSEHELFVQWDKENGLNRLKLTAIDSLGCRVSSAFSINFIDPPVAGFEIDDSNLELFQNIPISNYSDGDHNHYTWYQNGKATSSEVDFQTQFDQPGEIEVVLEVVDTLTRCFSQHAQVISLDFESLWEVPNAFTPNGDGINDGFKAFKKNIKQSHIQIFNRWGELVYESNEVEFSWDGTHKSEDSKLGVYTYIANASDIIGNTYSKSGVVSLIR
jgi:gliding motility-associated-like protein